MTYVESQLLKAGWRKVSGYGHDEVWTRTGSECLREEAIVIVLREQRDAAYERGLRRGLAIAKQHVSAQHVRQWRDASEQMEREIEEAKR